MAKKVSSSAPKTSAPKAPSRPSTSRPPARSTSTRSSATKPPSKSNSYTPTARKPSATSTQTTTPAKKSIVRSVGTATKPATTPTASVTPALQQSQSVTTPKPASRTLTNQTQTTPKPTTPGPSTTTNPTKPGSAATATTNPTTAKTNTATAATAATATTTAPKAAAPPGATTTTATPGAATDPAKANQPGTDTRTNQPGTTAKTDPAAKADPAATKADLAAPAKAAPPKQVPLTQETVQGLTSKDQKAREASLETMRQQVAAGNPQALEQFQNVLTNDAATRDMEYKDAAALKQQAFDALASNPEQLGPKGYQALLQGASSAEQRQQATDILGKAAASGNAEALQSLRNTLGEQYGSGQSQQVAADALAQMGTQLKPSDYGLLTKGGEPAYNALGQAASRGEPAALQTLRQQLGERYSSNDNLSAQALAQAGTHLQPDDYQLLTKAHGGKAYEVLGQAAAQGTPAALDALREKVGGTYGHRDAANALAQAGTQHLGADDYGLLAKHADGAHNDDAAQKTLLQGAREGKPGAMDAIRAKFDDKSAYSRADGAELMGMIPEALQAQDTAKLGQLATKDQDAGMRQTASAALQQAVRAQNPPPGAYQALGQSIDAAAARGDKDHNDRQIVEGGRKAMVEAFTGTQDPQARAQIAEHVIDAKIKGAPGTFGHYQQGDAIMEQATKALQDRANKGDAKALDALSSLTVNGRREGVGDKATQGAARALEEAAANGQASQVVDTLQRDYQEQGRPHVTAALGRAASHLPEGDPRIDQVRQQMREGLNNNFFGNQGAVEGMKALAEKGKLQQEDFNALLQKFPPGTGDVLGASMQHMDATQKGQILDQLGQKLGGNAERNQPIMDTYGQLAEHLRPADVQTLQEQQGWRANNTLGQILDKNATPATKKAAADALLADRPYGQNLNSLVNYAQGQNDPALKQQVLGKLKTAPLGDSTLEKVAERYGESVSRSIQHAREGTEMHELGKLLQAKAMANDPKWGKHVDTAALDRKINELVAKPSMQKQMEQIRERAIQGVGGDHTARNQAEWLKSDDFQNRLKLLSPEQQQQTIHQELQKLGAINPGLAQEAASQLHGQAVIDNSLTNLQGMPAEKRNDALQSAIQQTLGTGKIPVEIADKIGGILGSLDDVKDTDKLGQALLGKLEKLQATDPQAAKALGVVKELNASGKLSAVLTGASLIGLATGDLPKNDIEAAQMAQTIMGAAGNASDISKLFKLSEATKLGKAFKAAKVLGPAGDLFGAYADTRGAIKEFQQGDYHGGGAKAVGAAAGLTSAVAGAAILAGASGPLAPAVLLGAAVVGLGAMGYDHFFGKSDEQSFLENLGVYQ